MNIRVVADSSANLYSDFGNDGVDFVSVPLKIIAGEKEYVDDESLNVAQMLDELSEYKGKSGTSCPNIGDWLEAFGDAECVFCVALTSKISGGFNAAVNAAKEFMETHIGSHVFVLDSLTTGPELEILVERYIELIKKGLSFDNICRKIKEYLKRTHLMFSLESLHNFVNNGRVRATVAAAAKLLGICIVGQASEEGELEPLHKCMGRERAVRRIWKCMRAAGYNGGKVRIRHSSNEESANALANEIHEIYPDSDIRIGKNNGLCSYYAEKGGILVGFESEADEADE